MVLKQAAVIVNPASANGATARLWPKIAAAFEQEGLTFVHSFTEGPWDATRLTRRYLEEGYELIISVGGDGTANEVVNGFFHEGEKISENAAIGFISTGTGGDLGRTIGTPRDPAEATRHILSSPVRPVDLGKVAFINNEGKQETRYFINIAGLGLDGDIVERVNRTSKAFGGFLSFLWGTIVSLITYKNEHMAISVDGKLICDEKVILVVAGNGCYFGGGMQALPNALIDDGLFDIVILHNTGKLNLLVNLLPKVYRGAHLYHPCITSLRGKKLAVTADSKALLDLDGEQPGGAPVKIELLPMALNLKS